MCFLEMNPLGFLCTLGGGSKPLNSLYMLIGYHCIAGGWIKLVSIFPVYYLTVDSLVGGGGRSSRVPVSAGS